MTSKNKPMEKKLDNHRTISLQQLIDINPLAAPGFVSRSFPKAPSFQKATLESKKKLAHENGKKIIALCSQYECLLCLNEDAMQWEECPTCKVSYKDGKLQKYKLYMHYVLMHHPVGIEIKNVYWDVDDMCYFDSCQRKFSKSKQLSRHIISKHVYKWIQLDHLKNCKHE